MKEQTFPACKTKMLLPHTFHLEASEQHSFLLSRRHDYCPWCLFPNLQRRNECLRAKGFWRPVGNLPQDTSGEHIQRLKPVAQGIARAQLCPPNPDCSDSSLATRHQPSPQISQPQCHHAWGRLISQAAQNQLVFNLQVREFQRKK